MRTDDLLINPQLGLRYANERMKKVQLDVSAARGVAHEAHEVGISASQVSVVQPTRQLRRFIGWRLRLWQRLSSQLATDNG